MKASVRRMQLHCFPICLVSAIYWVSIQSQAGVGFWNVTVTKKQVQGKCTRRLCCGLRVTELGVSEAWRAPHPGIPATSGTTPWTSSPLSPPVQAPPQWGTGKTWEAVLPTSYSLESSGGLYWECPLSLLQKMSTSKRYMCQRTHFIKRQTQSSEEVLQGLN